MVRRRFSDLPDAPASGKSGTPGTPAQADGTAKAPSRALVPGSPPQSAVAPADVETRETLDLLCQLVANLSDRLDAQATALDRLAQAQEAALASPGRVADAASRATTQAVRETVLPDMRKLLDVMEDLTGKKEVLQARLRAIRRHDKAKRGGAPRPLAHAPRGPRRRRGQPSPARHGAGPRRPARRRPRLPHLPRHRGRLVARHRARPVRLHLLNRQARRGERIVEGRKSARRWAVPCHGAWQGTGRSVWRVQGPQGGRVLAPAGAAGRATPLDRPSRAERLSRGRTGGRESQRAAWAMRV